MGGHILVMQRNGDKAYLRMVGAGVWAKTRDIKQAKVYKTEAAAIGARTRLRKMMDLSDPINRQTIILVEQREADR